jgi:hypothetical protein
LAGHDRSGLENHGNYSSQILYCISRSKGFDLQVAYMEFEARRPSSQV